MALICIFVGECGFRGDRVGLKPDLMEIAMMEVAIFESLPWLCLVPGFSLYGPGGAYFDGGFES